MQITIVVNGLDGDIVRFALNDKERILRVGFVFGRAPDDKVSAGMTRSTPGDFKLFVHLVDDESVFIGKNAEVFLSDGFFRCFNEPLLAYVAPDFSLFAADGKLG